MISHMGIFHTESIRGFFRPGITAKLLFLNIFIFGIFCGIIGIMAWSFGNIKDLSAKMVQRDVPKVIASAALQRELSHIFSRTHLLISTFYGNPPILVKESAGLFETLENLRKQKIHPELADLLILFEKKLLTLFGECGRINVALKRVERIDGKVHLLLDRLLSHIMDEMDDPLLSFFTDSGRIQKIEQQIFEYREATLRAALAFSRLSPVTTETREIEKVFSMLNRLKKDFLKMPSLNPGIEELQDRLIETTQEYQEVIVQFNYRLIDFHLRLKELDEIMAKTQQQADRLDQKTVSDIQNDQMQNREMMDDILHFVLFLSLVMIVLLAAFSYIFFLLNFRRPIRAICKAVRAVGNGDLDMRVTLNRTDEWGVIENALNQMVKEIWDSYSELYRKNETLQKTHQELQNSLEKLKAEIIQRKKAEEEREHLFQKLLHARKMEAIGTLAGGVAHEFNNLMQGIQGHCELLLLRAGDDAKTEKQLESIISSVSRGRNLVHRLLTFARKVEGNPVPIDLDAKVHGMKKLLQQTLPPNIDIHVREVGPLKKVMADPVQVEQVLMNLTINAGDAMPRGGEIFIETENAEIDSSFCRAHPSAKSGSYVLLRLRDTGSGMDSRTLENIFNPFFTTKTVGKGTGMGLPMVFGIVRESGGYMTCQSEPGKGTTFSIFLPTVQAGDGVPAGPIDISNEKVLS